MDGEKRFKKWRQGRKYELITRIQMLCKELEALEKIDERETLEFDELLTSEITISEDLFRTPPKEVIRQARPKRRKLATIPIVTQAVNNMKGCKKHLFV